MENIKRLNKAIRFITALIGVSLFVFYLKGAEETKLMASLKGAVFLSIALMFLLEAYLVISSCSWREEGMKEKVYFVLKVMVWTVGAYFYGSLGVSLFF